MADAQKERALQCKAQGNKLYGEHKLSEAYKCYSEASKLSPEDAVFIANKSAVLFEAGLYDAAIAVSEEALQKLPNHDADNKGLEERLRLRKAKSAFLAGNFSSAVSILESSTPTANDEWKRLLVNSKAYLERSTRCADPENAPFAFDCAVPTLKGSLLLPFRVFDRPFTYETPLSILRSHNSSLDTRVFDLGAQSGSKASNGLNFLFAQNSDPRHLLLTLKHAHSLIEAEKIEDPPKISCHILETNARVLARFVLLLYVLGHRDLDENRSRMASDFAYFLWLSEGLIPPHWTMLRETLHELCKLSFNLQTWSLDPRSSWITFADERDLKMVRDVWITQGNATEDEAVSRENFAARLKTLSTAAKDESHKKKTSLPSSLEKQLRQSPECSRELDFFNQHRVPLPRPTLLEGDKELPPKSMKQWLANPTLDISDAATAVKGEKIEIFEARPDAIFPFGRAQPSQDPTPPSLYASAQLFDFAIAIKSLKERAKLELRFWCGQFTDLCDVGSRIGGIVLEEGLSFDRIHTGSLCDSIGLLSTFVTSTWLLSPHPSSSFYTSFGEQVTLKTSHAQKYAYESVDHILWNRLRMERQHVLSRFGFSVNTISTSNSNDNSAHVTLVWQRNDKGDNVELSSLGTSESDVNRGLSRVDALNKANEAYKTEFMLQNVFGLCVLPAPVSVTQIQEPAAANMATFLRFTTLLLRHGHPVHWVSQTIEKLAGEDIKISILKDPLAASNERKPVHVSTHPYMMELRTLLTIQSIGVKVPTNLDHPLLEDIANCHWFQAENALVHNYAPTLKWPYNPSIIALIVNKSIKFDAQLSLVERLSTCEGQSNFREILQKHAKDVSIVSAVYWTGPAKLDEESKVTFGFWLPAPFVAACQPVHQHSIILYRTDIYLCLGLSSLSAMACKTAE